MLCPVTIPEGLREGQTFIALTPDGQQMQVVVPEGSRGGTQVTFSYLPVGMPPATVVGQPVGCGGNSAGNLHSGPYGERYGYPTVDNFHMLVAPPLNAMEMQEEVDRRQDKRTSEFGWIMYFIGWGLCCCCGPVGPILWLGVACMHWSKPKEQRAVLQQERAVAITSLTTAFLCFVLIALMLIMYVSSEQTPFQSSTQSPKTQEQNYYGYQR